MKKENELRKDVRTICAGLDEYQLKEVQEYIRAMEERDAEAVRRMCRAAGVPCPAWAQQW